MYPSWDLARWRKAPPLLEGGIYRVLAAAFGRDPTRVALQTPEGGTLTYGELGCRVEAARMQLADLGVAPGDRVLAYLEKSVAGVVLYLACLSRGAVYIPVNPDYTSAELDGVVNDARPRLVVGDGYRAAQVSRYASESVVGILREDGTIARRSARAGAADPRQSGPTGNDPAVILYTSGTTGKPRGVVLTHRAVLANGLALCRAWKMAAGDVLLHALPLFHTHGLLVALNCAMMSGASILFAPAFDSGQAARLLGRATVFMGVPTYYTRLLEQPALSRPAVSRIRLFTCGSAPLLPQVWEEFEARTGHRIVERYGMTEVGIITSNPYGGPRMAGTVGFPLEGVEIKVALDGPDPAGPGTVGELQVRSPGAFSGYLNQPDETARVAGPGGWVRTGDLGAVDRQGRVTLAGRAKDLVITGGLNVHPLEVETALQSLPGVVESAVFGVPHPDYGEAVAAAVVWKGADDAARAVRRGLGSRLAGYKIPKRILITHSLPRNAMGKVQKQVLRSQNRGLFV